MKLELADELVTGGRRSVNARNCKELSVLDSLMEEDLGVSLPMNWDGFPLWEAHNQRATSIRSISIKVLPIDGTGEESAGCEAVVSTFGICKCS